MSALIKFEQGANLPPGGRAIDATLNVPITCRNTDNVGPPATVTWLWEMLDVPPGSSVPTGVMGTTQSVTFTPDKPYGYRVRLTTTDANGNTSVDIRCALVRDIFGRIIPPFDAAAGELNINGQTRGWAPFMESWLNEISFLTGAFPAVNGGLVQVSANDFDYVGNAKGTVRTRNRNVQTVDATVTDLFTWTIQPGQTVVDALVTAIKSDASQGANYKLKRRFRYGALGPVPGALVNLETDEDDATWDCTIDNNGTTGRVRVTGKAATTIQWFGVIQIVEVVP